MDWLKKQEPVVLWDTGKRRPVLKTQADWTKAGEIVVDEPVAITEEQGIFTLSDVRNVAWYESAGCPLPPTANFLS
jgi:NADH dehydrogenase FAD-containing subunit